MTQTQQLQQLDPETLQDFQELHDAREEALRLEGREIGLEEGKLDKAREIARKMLAQSIPHNTIAALTGLSLDEIAALIPPPPTPPKTTSTQKKKA